MVEITGYCMKCKAKRIMKNPKKMAKGYSGICSKCGTKMFRMGLKTK